MASNYFTAPFGLHPTPSTCFPPPPPPAKGTTTGSLVVTPQTGKIGTGTILTLTQHNSLYQTGVPIPVAWTHTGLDNTPPDHVGNGVILVWPMMRTQQVGTFTIKAKLTYPNGQIRTYQYIIANTP